MHHLTAWDIQCKIRYDKIIDKQLNHTVGEMNYIPTFPGLVQIIYLTSNYFKLSLAQLDRDLTNSSPVNVNSMMKAISIQPLSQHVVATYRQVINTSTCKPQRTKQCN